MEHYGGIGVCQKMRKKDQNYFRLMKSNKRIGEKLIKISRWKLVEVGKDGSMKVDKNGKSWCKPVLYLAEGCE